jgi:hypothetical protein
MKKQKPPRKRGTSTASAGGGVMKKVFLIFALLLLAGCAKNETSILGIGVVESVYQKNPTFFKIRLIKGGDMVEAMPEEIWDNDIAVGDSVLVSSFENENKYSAFSRRNPVLFILHKQGELEKEGKNEYIPFIMR